MTGSRGLFPAGNASPVISLRWSLRRKKPPCLKIRPIPPACDAGADLIKVRHPTPYAPMSISDLRQGYDDAPRFDVHDLEPDPADQFHRWFKDAVEAQIMEPNAMTLASVDALGWPDARVVLLKDADEQGFTFYTNYLSAKAEQIDNCAQVCLVFYWDVLFRQVRIRGTIAKVGRDEAQAYWDTRPRASQLGAIASHQSQTLDSRTVLEENFAKAAEQYRQAQVIPLPDDWGGYRVTPETVEFWQGQPSRLHDRFVYVRREDGGWKTQRLAP